MQSIIYLVNVFVLNQMKIQLFWIANLIIAIAIFLTSCTEEGIKTYETCEKGNIEIPIVSMFRPGEQLIAADSINEALVIYEDSCIDFEIEDHELSTYAGESVTVDSALFWVRREAIPIWRVDTITNESGASRAGISRAWEEVDECYRMIGVTRYDRLLLAHELGHQMFLLHVSDINNIMHPDYASEHLTEEQKNIAYNMAIRYELMCLK
jgi:hypothetical protein